MQDLGKRWVGDIEVISIANELGYSILTRDSDFARPNIISKAQYGILYIAYQPLKEEITQLAHRIANIAKDTNPDGITYYI